MTQLLPVATSIAVAVLWPTPAFACGGACSTDVLGGFSILAVVIGVVFAVNRTVSSIRRRRTTRAFEEGGT